MQVSPNVGLRARHDDSKGVSDFRQFLLAKSAERYTDLKRPVILVNDDVVSQLKASSPAQASTSLSSPFSLALERLIAINTPRSAFNVMRPFMTQVPLRTRIVVAGALIGSSQVAEGAAKLFRSMSFSELDTEAAKFAAAVAISQEFIDQAPELAGRVLADTLAEAVARATDVYFLGKLNAGEVQESVVTPTDPSFDEMLNEIAALIRVVKTGDRSRLYLVLRQSTLKYLSAAAYSNGITTLKWNGGELMGIQVVGSDSQTTGFATLVDASGVIYGDDGVGVRSSNVAAVELSDSSTQNSVTPVQTTLVSCFQTNTRAVIAEQRISVRVGDTNAVAALSGVAWGAGDASPSFS